MRISATQVEAFSRWKKEEDSLVSDMRDYLLNKIPPTKPMIAGTAFHKLLELSQYGSSLDVVKSNGITFDFSKLDSEIEMSKIREAKMERSVLINDIQTTVVGVVDGQVGNGVFDHKLTSRFDAETYADSYQWRFYLHWFNFDWIQYNVFESKVSSKDENVYEVRAFHKLKFTKYPEISRDVENLCKEYSEFVIKYVPELVNK